MIDPDQAFTRRVCQAKRAELAGDVLSALGHLALAATLTRSDVELV